MKKIKDVKKGRLFIRVLGLYLITPCVIVKQHKTDRGVVSHWDYLDKAVGKPQYTNGLTRVLEFNDFTNLVKREFYERIE